MTPEQVRLVERVRACVADEAAVREVSMFGGRSVMVNEKMIVSVRKDGGLLVRIDDDRHDALVTRPGAKQAVMGRDRDMGPGWIEVSADALGSDEELASWIEVAMEHNRRTTSGPGAGA